MSTGPSDEITRVDSDAGRSSSSSRAASPPALSEWLKEQVKESFGARLGRYVLLRVLGEGGMGVVFAAYDEELDRKVAIKLLQRKAQGAGWDESWLRNEAKAMARLSHPNIVQVYDVGQEEGALFVAMEFLVGVSLRDWLRAKRRSLREIVEVSVQAGRGLQAAHAAGLVHCDYKPQNVLVGDDGRVRVLDFGLARLREQGPTRQTLRPDDSIRTTLVGGTPAYMAPELYLRGDPDARSDQFAFCVALYDALYGKKPFAGKTIDELKASICAGEVEPPPSDARVPAWLRRAVLRGLAVQPADRWPSMEALLAELSRDPARTLRRWALGLGAVALVGASAATIAHNRALEAELAAGRCTGVADLEGAWTEPRREAARAAFAATGLSFADDTFARVAARIDAYTGEWTAMRTEACESNRSGAQSDLLYERRVACLEQRRAELSALVDVLATADPGVVTKAVKATGDLRPLAGCADADVLLAALAPPDTPELALAVARARQDLVAARAEFITGRYKVVKEKLAAPRAASEELGYRPLRAEVLYIAGLAEDGLGDAKAAAADLEEAVWAAESSRHDALAAEAAIRLMFVTGFRLTQFDVARRWERHTQAILDRRGGARELESRWLSSRAVVASRAGDFKLAMELAQSAVPIAERLFGQESYEVASLLGNIGGIAGMSGDHRTAAEFLNRAAGRMERVLGPEHPEVATTYGNLGSAALAVGDLEAAVRHTEHAREILARAFGDEHPELARIYNNLGTLRVRAEKYGDAIPWYERALALRIKLLGKDHTDTANTAGNLADAYLNLGQPAKALVLIEQALAGHRASVGEKHPRYGATLGMRGRAEVALGRTRAGIATLEAAIASMSAHPNPIREFLGEARFALARALWPDRRARPRALALAREAAEDLDAAGAAFAKLHAEITAWQRERAG